MKMFLTTCIALWLTRVVTGLRFDQYDGAQRALLDGDGGLNGCWGQFKQDGSCLQKILDPSDLTAYKVKFMPCNVMEPTQMWKFHNGMDYEYYDLLYNMDGGCLAIRGDVGEGKNLKVMDCDRTKAKQQWYSDGDSLQPVDYQDTYCVSATSFPIAPRDPVVLLKCENAPSLDY